MKTLLTILLVLIASVSFAGQGCFPGMGIKGYASDPCAGGYKVKWDMTADGLDCYNATDGSTTTTNGLTYSVDGAEFNANTDYAEFACTNGNSINQALWEIGFKYKKTGTPASYAFFFEHSASTKAIALLRDGTSTTAFRLYVNGYSTTLTSTVTTFYDGNEHSLVVTYDDATNAVSLSIDGETPVTGTNGYSATLTTGYLSIGNSVAHDSQCAGIVSDFYIK